MFRLKKIKCLNLLKSVFLIVAILLLLVLAITIFMQIVEVVSVATIAMVICAIISLIAFCITTKLIRNSICTAVIDYAVEVLKKENVDQFEIKCSYVDHNKEYLNFRIALKAKISPDVYSRCCTLISQYLESIEPILRRETYMTMEVF